MILESLQQLVLNILHTNRISQLDLVTRSESDCFIERHCNNLRR